MCPRPINPHDAKLLPLDAKDLLFIVDTVSAAPPFPSKHNFEGENRTETEALMFTVMPSSFSLRGTREKSEKEEEEEETTDGKREGSRGVMVRVLVSRRSG